MATSHIQELSKNSLYALQNVFELNTFKIIIEFCSKLNYYKYLQIYS